MSNQTQSMIQIIAKYFETQPVLKAWLFGSFARGEEKPWSDVDILFVPDYSGKPFTLLTMGGMYLDLRELLGREVDLVEDGSLRPYAVESVERDKMLIYDRDNKDYFAESNWTSLKTNENPFNDVQDAVYKSIVGMAKNMRARGMSSQEIAEITGLSELEIREL